MDVTVTIPSPTVPVSPATSFLVVIKNASGTIVYTDYETNLPFVVPGLASGNYTCYVTYGGHTTGWCFNVSACVCPVVESSIITQPSPGLYYLNIIFDISDVEPSDECPFTIFFNDGIRRSPFIITDNSQFTSIAGTTATLTLHISGPSCSVNIFDEEGCTCYTASLTYSCTAPAFPTVIPAIVEIGSSWFLQLVFPNCGGTCHTFTVNYAQTNTVPRVPPDTSTATITLDCSDTFPVTKNIPLHPAATASLTGVESYTIYMVNCCGTASSTLFGPYNSEPTM